VAAPLVFDSLGGRCELFGDDPAALAAVRAWIARMHDRLTRFTSDSELSGFNRSAGAWTAVSPELEALLRVALGAYDQSGGLVHVGVLPALLAAGYTRDLAAGPTPRTAERVLVASLPEVLAVRRGEARLAAGNAIDLGGIAKGWLADRLAERLGENCVVNLGGDLFARGIGPEGEGWPIGFGGTTIYLRDQGAATSGTDKRRWGPDLHHLVDPRTGRPAKSNLKEVSVIAATGTDAEIYAKTALLLGRQSAEFYLEQHSPGWWLSP